MKLMTFTAWCSLKKSACWYLDWFEYQHIANTCFSTEDKDEAWIWKRPRSVWPLAFRAELTFGVSALGCSRELFNQSDGQSACAGLARRSPRSTCITSRWWALKPGERKPSDAYISFFLWGGNCCTMLPLSASRPQQKTLKQTQTGWNCCAYPQVFLICPFNQD